ncbi:MAG: hypothetical protein COX57_05355 [Alphaproteobacteria bacterium CG_4_10_14_0_2_um_filter_63_37]|nr:MAG: hypothetical protein AUJ55_02975 [Proteobacteria bacterium CG1_02_64_396]PJA25054.1 MAG: hypothetical protein COX57_05355 [Alphaproteobacteria bacterium CG_4_10_14_0_2_um_filter_63_37]
MNRAAWLLLGATLRFQWQGWKTHRLGMVQSLIWVAASALMFFGIDRLFALLGDERPLDIGASYLAYVLIGMAVNGVVMNLMFGLGKQMGRIEYGGQLAWMWSGSTHLPLPLVLLIGAVPGLGTPLLEMGLFALVAWALGIALPEANWLAGAVVLLVSMLAFVGFGLITAASQLWLKKGNPLGFLFGGVATILAGLYFPVSVLPEMLHPIALAIPLTYTFDGLRDALIHGASWVDVWPDLAMLTLFGAGFWVAGLWGLRAAKRRVLEEGSLGLD